MEQDGHAPLVLPLPLVSLVRLVLEVVITALRAIFVAALQASATVDPERIITVGLERIITAVMVGETATMACLPTAITARPMPMTAVTTPIGETSAWWFAAASDADNRAAQFLIHRSRFQDHGTPPMLAQLTDEKLGASAERTEIKSLAGGGTNQATLSPDDGTRAARLLALSMALLFCIISVLQAISW